MITTLFTLALSFSSLAHGSAIPHSSPNVRREPGILRLPVTATKNSLKRQTVSTVENVQAGTRYMVEFSIGTPPQPVALALDTGSSETWVNPVCADSGNQLNIDLCNSFPRYVANSSSTAKDLTFGTTLTYGKGTAVVEYFTDNFELGGATVKTQQFGVTKTSYDQPVGLMGVGFGRDLVGYPNIIDSLANQGITNGRAFSLDLRGYETPDGAIIFGGVDTAKYTGALEKLPIIPASSAPDQYMRYWVHLSSIGITKPGQAKKTYTLPTTDSKGLPVFLDSGSTLSTLPTAILNDLVADFGATEDGSSGLYTVDCAMANTEGFVNFGFGNTVINVPYSEFVWHILGLCYLGVTAEDTSPILGDTFLRAAYVVYDQDNQNIHVANAANCGTNLVAITTGVDAVPSITGQCAGASSTSTASSVSGFPTLSASSSAPYALSNHSTTAGPTATYTTKMTTSTGYSTSKYMSGGIVTQTVVAYTTVCPVTEKVTPTYAPAESTTHLTKTVYATKTYTVSKCPASVTNCPYGHKTTSLVPISTTVYSHSYYVTTVAGYPVAPYDLVAKPVPVAPTVPIVFPVPAQTLPPGITINYPTAPTSTPAAALPPVNYKTVETFTASPYPTYAPVPSYPVGGKPTYSAYPTGGVPSNTTVFTGTADSMRVGNLWAVAFVALGFLVMV